MNSATIVFASFVTFIFCSVVVRLSMSKEQRDLADLEYSAGLEGPNCSDDLDGSFTKLQNMMLNLAALSITVFSVAGVFMIIELILRLK